MKFDTRILVVALILSLVVLAAGPLIVCHGVWYPWSEKSAQLDLIGWYLIILGAAGSVASIATMANQSENK